MGIRETYRALIENLISAGRFLEQQGLIIQSSGNLSLKLPGGMILVTGRGTHLGALNPADLAVVDSKGSRLEGEREPTSELALHLAVYRRRPEVGAIVHTHSPHATALAVSRLEIPPLLDELTVLIGGAVAVSEYAEPGTEGLARNALIALDGRGAVLLANHGVVAVGRDMEGAVKIAHLVEHAARVYLLARSTGTVRTVPPESLERQRAEI